MRVIDHLVAGGQTATNAAGKQMIFKNGSWVEK